MSQEITRVQQHIALLGMEVRDQVTLFSGVVTSIGFDLFGCIQAVVTPKASDTDTDAKWFDVSRLVITGERVMPIPEYSKGYIADGMKGSADKPIL
ncbi:hypothetical protein P4S73_04795 [Paraglaciecola sp. Hal342]